MLLPLLLLSTGCGPSVHGPYSDARMEALGETQNLATNWGPEALFHLDKEVLERVLRKRIRDALKTEEEGFRSPLSDGLSPTLTPHYQLDRLQWERRSRCPTCFRARTHLAGRVPWTLGQQRGELTGEMEIDFDFWLRSSWKEDSSKIELVISEILRVEGRVSQLRGESLQPSLTQWAHARMQEGSEPIHLATVGGPALPLLDIRVVPNEAGVRLEMASNIGSPRPIRTASPVMEGDWVAGISANTLLALARRSTFEQGVNSAGLHADLRKLQVFDDRFQLFVRLWSVQGRGWWRDYALRGQVVVDQNEILFQPDAVTLMGNSRGAGEPDVMGLFTQNGWLNALGVSAREVLPIPTDTERDFQLLTLEIRQLMSQDDVLWMSGEARIIP